MEALPSLLVFGPQTTWPAPAELASLKEVLVSDSRLQPLLDATKNLNALWADLLAFDADLSAVEGSKTATGFQQWTNGEELPSISETQPNVLVTPLTVLVHILQYFQYLKQEGSGVSHSQVLESTQGCGIQGFCTGFLSAIAVATGKNETDIGELAAVSLRLAFAVGALVDLADIKNPEGAASCLAVRWRSEEGKGILEKLMQDIPGAYISVITDTSSVTVTVPKKHTAQLSEELAKYGMATKPVQVHGRFHSVENTHMVQQLKEFCESQECFQIPCEAIEKVPLRSNITSELISAGSLRDIALETMLVERSNWYSTFAAAFEQYKADEPAKITVAGYVDAIPSSVVRQHKPKITKLSDYHLNPHVPSLSEREPNDDAVAIIGMSCKFPGADTVEEYWHLLREGLTVIDQVPDSRFHTEGLRRTADGKTPFWGSFVKDPDAFDHEFFKKSPREAVSMDPKQRMLLEGAYQALESSGQWAHGDTAGHDIGCYIGVATDDYYDNVNSHAPNAFSATGTLRAFLSGKISHFFGWTGPSITYDTACSSSLVAIHAACASILKGECSRAVAGGVNAISSPNMYQNLAAATFLSKTGICKPFDAKADGYCRGEGVGLVYLKKLSAARADGDNVIAVIAGSATNQNNNETPITVPHSGSQIELYERVLQGSGVLPQEVSYVEAHGTGTPVGDPRECLSIRQVFGGSKRTDIVHIGSAKGNIGHLEAASGVASLIKTLLMMQHQTIPKAASYQTINPNIPALEPDGLSISTSTKPWMPSTNVRVACVNNYGASGNNAALLVYEGGAHFKKVEPPLLSDYPIFLSAKTDDALQRYCAILQKTIQKANPSLGDVAYHLQRTQNRTFPYSMITKAKDIEEFTNQLSSPSIAKMPAKTKPVILAFGGQTSTFVGLDESAYKLNPVFQRHIDDCDQTARSLGLDGVLPEIFNPEPIQNLITLHACFFAIQYATAKSWIDAGLPVDAVVGHSFGQLTALCVSGRLSLEDGLKLVTGRAALMKKLWGPVRGSMVSVQASTSMVDRLVTVVKQSAAGRELEIACYNGPNSHTLVGNPASVDAVMEIVAARPHEFSAVKTKKLNVTHGFHSVFTEPLLNDVTQLASTLKFADSSKIYLETCSRRKSWNKIRPEMLAEHTRTPVYFNDAVKRLVDSYGPSTWIEAGTGSGITSMVRAALGAPQNGLHSFETVALNKGDSVKSLSDVTANLWGLGYNVKFWPFYQMAQGTYSQINLPPYSFKKSRHWLPYLDALKPTVAKPIDTTESVPEEIDMSEAPLVSLAKYLDKRQESAQFSINKHNTQFQLATKGHAVLDQPLTPAGEYIELAIQAAMILQPDSNPAAHLWSVDSLSIMAPLGIDTEVPLKCTLTEAGGSKTSFEFQLTSEKPGAKPVVQATGKVGTHPLNDQGIMKDFARTSRLVDCSRYEHLIGDDNAELLQGSLVYKVFSKVVTYLDFYKGVRKVASKDSEIAAHIIMPIHSHSELNSTSCNSLAIDNFLQVAGMHVNCLKQCGEGEVYVATNIGRIQPGPSFHKGNPNSWFVYSNFSRTSDRDVLNDIYVFDTRSHDLVMIIHDVNFTKVPIAALARNISKANVTKESSTQPAERKASIAAPSAKRESISEAPSKAVLAQKQAEEPKAPKTTETSTTIKKLVHEVTDVDIASMEENSAFEDLGIDSLMIHEIQTEIKSVLNVDVPSGELGHMTISSLAKMIDSNGPSEPDSEETPSESSPAPSKQSSASSDVDAGDETPATSVSEDTAPSTNKIAELGKFVAEQLGTTSTMSRETSLGDQGLDSLMSLELGQDIEAKFGVHIEHGWLTAETTFGQLCDKVIPPVAPTIPTVQSTPKPDKPPRKGKIDMETVMWKECDSLMLYADVYLPQTTESPRGTWSPALMIHGGGHTMLSRKDVRPPQTQYLLDNGFIPVSVDYRLSPEINIRDGAMVDVCDALDWVRHGLPKQKFKDGMLKINNEKVIVIGWSTGGTLSMTLPFNSVQRNIQPPDAVLAFYCPTDYEADCWVNPNYPENSESSSKNTYDLLEGVNDQPITAYNIPTGKSNVGGWMNLQDPRSRIVLHMNWKGQALPILLGGLPSKTKVGDASREQDYYNLKIPSKKDIMSISPASQIRLGNYQVPTFLIHGTQDDLIPWQQTQQTYEDLAAKGIPAGVRIVEDKVHLFDLYRDPGNEGWKAVRDGYDFLFSIAQ